MLFKDLINIIRLDIAIPDSLRIDNNDRAMAAMVQTAGAVDADRIAQTCIGYTPLQTAKQGIRVAVKPAVGSIGADEDMFLVL